MTTLGTDYVCKDQTQDQADELNYSAAKIIQRVHALRSHYIRLLSDVSDNSTSDISSKWTHKAGTSALSQLSDIERAINQLQSDPLFFAQHLPDALSETEVLAAAGYNDDVMSPQVRAWRRDLTTKSYQSIPLESQKEIFDYFFRFDAHGSLRQEETIYLSRGVSDPFYFCPPAVVHAALEIAAEKNWFGYSDSLGHGETRKAICRLEQCRRHQNDLTEDHVAVMQGGISGLNAVLSLIARERPGTSCLMVKPNYAPIMDAATHYLQPKLVDLNSDYTLNKKIFIEAARDDNISIILLSVPHNPSGQVDLSHTLDELHAICASKGSYIIIDEISYDKNVSQFFDPVKYPNLIVISSYSKCYKIPGLKLGHMLASAAFISRFYRHASTTYGSPPSYLYLTCSALAESELAHINLKPCTFPPSMVEICSHTKELFAEFELWRDLCNVMEMFRQYAFDTALLRNDCKEKITFFGLEDTSPNVTIRLPGERNAYKLFLRLMAKYHISVMPIDCFIPPVGWPCDLRISLRAAPLELTKGLMLLMRFISEELKND